LEAIDTYEVVLLSDANSNLLSLLGVYPTTYGFCASYHPCAANYNSSFSFFPNTGAVYACNSLDA
jgi:hypothetical protein|tara:strand:- start:109 stop:303 length:195 start_codon:yes stop_codon:yes gene_type:complete